MAPVTPFAVTNPGASHVIIELFGGDNSLSAFVNDDLAEMADGLKAAPGNTFTVLGLADTRASGGAVIEIGPDGTARRIEDLGEIDTGDPETLAEFIARALVSYPTARKALGFWDHGSGVFDEQDSAEVLLDRLATRQPGGPAGNRRGPTRLGDLSVRASHRGTRRRAQRSLFVGHLARTADESRRASYRAMMEDDSSGGILTNYEAYGVLRAGFGRAGQHAKIDMIFSDTCLNGMIEVLDQFRPFASVVVGSEELEPGDGWDYTRFIGLMAKQPPRSAVEWASMAVTSYGDGYRNRPDEYPCTLAAFRTRNSIATSFRALLGAVRPLGSAGFAAMDDARSYSQAFAGYNSYDLRDFAARLAKAKDAGVAAGAARLVHALDAASVASVALGDDVADAHGLAFWFPSQRGAYVREAETYGKLAFPKRTGWATYLRKRYG